MPGHGHHKIFKQKNALIFVFFLCFFFLEEEGKPLSSLNHTMLALSPSPPNPPSMHLVPEHSLVVNMLTLDTEHVGGEVEKVH